MGSGRFVTSLRCRLCESTGVSALLQVIANRLCRGDSQAAETVAQMVQSPAGSWSRLEIDLGDQFRRERAEPR